MTDRSTPGAGESLAGQVLDGRYRVGELLGTGSFGRVYEGHHTSLMQRVAIKVFRSDVVASVGGPERVLGDARAASRIHHRNVVDVHDIGRLGDTVYVVTELVLGRTLHACLLQAGRLPWSRARGVALQIAAALKAAHKRDVLHRGLRAANCFVLEDLAPAGAGEPRVKVSDFGFAHPGLAGGERGEDHTSPFVGDAAYTAPELAKGDAASVRSDMYAFGVLLYRMLAGALPFEGGTPYQVLAAHVERPVPPLREKVRSVPAEVEAIVLRALAKDPSERFESMRELELALEEVPAQAVGEADQAAPSAALDELVTGQHAQAPVPAVPERDAAMHAAFEQRVDEPGELVTSMFDRHMPYFGPTSAVAAPPEPTIQLGLAMLEQHALELPSAAASGLPQLMPGVRPERSAFPQLMSSVQYVPSPGGGSPEATMMLDGRASSPVAEPTTVLTGDVQSFLASQRGRQHEADDELVDAPTLHHPIGGVLRAAGHQAPPQAGRPSVAVHAPAAAASYGGAVAAYGVGAGASQTPAAQQAAPVVGHAPAPVVVHAAAPAIGPAPAGVPVAAYAAVARHGVGGPRALPGYPPAASASSTIAAINVLIIMMAVVIAGALVLLALTCSARRSAGERASSLRLPVGETVIAGGNLTSEPVDSLVHG